MDIDRESRTLRFAGAEPEIVHAPVGEGFRVYAKASDGFARGVPNVTVFRFPNGQCGAATERAATTALKRAFDAAAVDVAGRTPGEQDAKWCAEVHRSLVSWLRREWAIGRVRRLPTGEWDLIESTS